MPNYDPNAFENEYLFNPNQQATEDEEQKKMRIQQQRLKEMMATDEEVASAQKAFDRADALRNTKGPQGRSVGSRNTFVAASPFEHAAHVWASKIRGDTAKDKEAVLQEKLGKQRAGRAEEQAREIDDKAEIMRIKQEQADAVGENYDRLKEKDKNDLALNQKKANETERHNRAMEEERLAKINAKNTNYKSMTQKGLTDIVDAGSVLQGMKKSEDTFNDSFARPAGGLPIVSTAITNMSTTAGVNPYDIAASVKGALGMDTGGEENKADSKNFKDAAEWLAGWRQSYTLLSRNKLFGATLTTNEQKAWDQAGEINLNMDADEIRSRMAAAYDIKARRAGIMRDAGVTNGHNPELYEGAGLNSYKEVSAEAHIDAIEEEEKKKKKKNRTVSWKSITGG